jgi:glycosyltransferase involved in cell wall biosynthesis
VMLGRSGPLDLSALHRYRSLTRQAPAALTLTVNQYPLAFVSAATLGLRQRPPLLHISHTIELPHEDSLLKRRLQALLKHRPQAHVYVCERQRQFWRRKGVDGADHCIHNGVDVSRFTPPSPEQRRAWRAATGVPEGTLLVGLCAGYRPEKRHDLLLQAVAELKRRGHAVHALLIGDGALRPAIEAQARALGVESELTLTGYSHDVRPWMGACDALCLVSDHETFSLAILEGMACGLPVVATQVGAVEEQINDGLDGLLVPAGDATALADALWQLSDAHLRSHMGLRARRKVLARFDLLGMNARYLHLVREHSQAAP